MVTGRPFHPEARVGVRWPTIADLMAACESLVGPTVQIQSPAGASTVGLKQGRSLGMIGLAKSRLEVRQPDWLDGGDHSEIAVVARPEEEPDAARKSSMAPVQAAAQRAQDG